MDLATQGPCPVREGGEYTLLCEAEGEKGDGLFKISGLVIFVPGAKKGETVHFWVTRVLAKVAFGEVVR